MAKKLLFSLTFVLCLFSLNIYYELRNIPKVQEWYDSLLNEDGSAKPNFKNNMITFGFRVIEIEQKENDRLLYVIGPPFDQGLLTTLSGRYFFPLAIYQDSDGEVIYAGLYK